MNFRLSQKVVLTYGDKIRVSSGPYYLSQSGNKIAMGERGTGIFIGVTNDQKIIYVKFGVGNIRLVYIGDTFISENGTIMRPHKIRKVRKKRC